MVSAGASDLHLKVGRRPIVRADGALRELDEPVLTHESVMEMVESMFNPKQLRRFEEENELDASYQPATVRDRFRVNVFRRMGEPGVVMRCIPRAIKSLSELGFPPTLKTLAHNAQGLVLLTGPTGSGKSTTLAAMMRELNETEGLHVITIEDPIEFVHDDLKCLVNQREVGIDTDSFAEALRRALRQDPDVILVGEMRDAETMRIATQAAETGHLVLSTLHTNDAKQSIDRIVNTFPPDEQRQVRLKLATTLRGIVCQSLVPKASGEGRVCIQEIMVNTPFIAELIKEGNLGKIDEAIRDGEALHGMLTKNKSLFEAWERGDISKEDAVAFSNRPTDLELAIRTREFERREKGGGASASAGPSGVNPVPEAASRIAGASERISPSAGAGGGSPHPGGERVATSLHGANVPIPHPPKKKFGFF